jgi:hypothetical protein
MLLALVNGLSFERRRIYLHLNCEEKATSSIFSVSDQVMVGWDAMFGLCKQMDARSGRKLA